MANIKLFVGLGNPDTEYLNTRHNAGFWFADMLANSHKAEFEMISKFFSLFTKFKYFNHEILIIKPQTYMNLSGKALLAVMNFYKIDSNNVFVAHDDLDIAIGVIKLKLGGGNGGHNGLKDIDNLIGTNYWRLRIGIGRPETQHKVINYVLKKPLSQEKILIDNAIEKLLKVSSLLFTDKYNEALKILHTK